MKIVIVCDVLGEENNGTTIAAMNLIRFLKSQGHEVRILCVDQEKKGQAGVYVVPTLNLGFLLNAYVAKVGVSLAKPEEFADKIVILTPGRYAREKSQDTLIRAVGYSKYRDRIQLILGGQGVLEKSYRKLARRLPVMPVFRFYSRQEIIDVLNYADIYVHPAEMELEGISCLEAIVCGKLTVVSDSKNAATKEFAIDEKCIFRNRRPKDLAKVIDYWIEHPQERQACAQKYYESAIAFRQDVCMQHM